MADGLDWPALGQAHRAAASLGAGRDQPDDGHLPKAFETDIRVRAHAYPIEGVKLEPTEIEQGLVFERNGVKVIAFEVDHGGEKLDAFGYRIEYDGRAAVLSGDTTSNENLIAHSEGLDVLVHEVAWGMGEGFEHKNLERIRRNHATAEEAGIVFSRTKPKLPVYTHLLLFGEATPEDFILATRPTYDGPLVVGHDLMQIDIGEEIEVSTFEPGPYQN